MVIWTLTWLSSLLLCCLVRTNCTQVFCIICGCGTETFNTPLIGVTQIIIFNLPWLNSYCPYASLRGNCPPPWFSFLVHYLTLLSPFPDFQLAVFLFRYYLIGPKVIIFKFCYVIGYQWPNVARRVVTCMNPKWRFYPFFLMCTPDNHPSSLARFKRSKTVKVKKFPILKNLNKTPLFWH
jgi:hypothetical protein